jgi:hypothetical protein
MHDNQTIKYFWWYPDESFMAIWGAAPPILENAELRNN